MDCPKFMYVICSFYAGSHSDPYLVNFTYNSSKVSEFIFSAFSLQRGNVRDFLETGTRIAEMRKNHEIMTENS